MFGRGKEYKDRHNRCTSDKYRDIDNNIKVHYFFIDRFDLATDAEIKKAQELLNNKCIFVLFNRHCTYISDGGHIAEYKLYYELSDDGMEYFRLAE